MNRVIAYLFVAFLIAAAAGCATLRPADPQTVEALNAECESLVSGSGIEATVPLDIISRRMIPGDISSVRLSSGSETFKTAAADADAIWWYDDTDDFGGMVTGESGLIATRGCTVIARETIVILN